MGQGWHDFLTAMQNAAPSELVPPKEQPVQAKSSKISLLVALTRWEMERFYPGGFSLENEHCSLHIENPDAHTPESWARRFDELAPRVLLSGWCTPPLAEPGDSATLATLGYVCHLGGAVRTLVPRSLIERGLTVTNWGSLAAPAVAEHALLLILGALRNVAIWPQYMEAGPDSWDLRTRSLRGLRVGLHGFGRIARALVPLLAPYEVGIKSYSAGVPSGKMEAFGVKPCSSLESLFSNTDVLVECEALTPATKGAVTRKLLGLLPEDAVFVNVGRGNVVDEAALREFAAAGRLRVALDVHEGDRRDTASPWRGIKQENRGLHSPHIGGPTHDQYIKCGQFALENLNRYFRGGTLLNAIDLAIYDRST
jgi:phosphoglycerate dehydrogenase-like enzyme